MIEGVSLSFCIMERPASIIDGNGFRHGRI
jgi:hypothetical protein